MRTAKTAACMAALLGCLALSAVCAQGAPAREATPSAPPPFKQLDRNHDGRLMRSEVPHDMHRLRAHFRQYDRDHNGSLSRQEYNAFAHPAKYRKLDS